MKKHRFNIFPEMQSDDYNRLKSDLATNGYDSKNPIYLYQGEILDGWNRQMACDELGITPVTTCFTGSDFDAINFVMRTNKRRNLNSSQWAAIAVEAEEMVQAIREKVEKEKAEKFIGNDNAAKDKTVRQLIDRPFSEPFVNKLSQGTNAHNSPYVAPSVRGDDEPIVNQKGVVIKPIVRADSILATTFNTNRTYINEAGKLRDNNPEAFEQVKRGEKTIPEVRKEIKRVERQEQKIFESQQMPEGVFDLVYCDPPWKYDFAETDNRKIENQYPTMTIDELCSMELPQISDNALLLMWATAPKLTEALRLITSWGFTYKTHGIWDKVNIGMGYWFRGQHELLLVATRGNYSPPEQEQRISSIYTERRGSHSSKPIFYYEWIEKSFPLAHKIELFSRVKRDRWEAWGNE